MIEITADPMLETIEARGNGTLFQVLKERTVNPEFYLQ